MTGRPDNDREARQLGGGDPCRVVSPGRVHPSVLCGWIAVLDDRKGVGIQKRLCYPTIDRRASTTSNGVLTTLSCSATRGPNGRVADVVLMRSAIRRILRSSTGRCGDAGAG